jgi:YHS domain-containing protein
VSKLIVLFLAITAAACSNESTASSQSEAPIQTTPAGLPAGMTRVADVSQVCMVNDQFMGKPQIPIAVEGRTYYGCCAMCKDRLGNDPKARTARDPVTGEQVDKATAVIVQDKTGKVMYFASEATLNRYRG